MRILGRREAAYLPRKVRLHYKEAPAGPALTFVFDPKHLRAAPRMSHKEQSRLIRQGQGARGTSRGYLAGVVAALHQDGARDAHAEKLHRLVEDQGA